MLPRSIPNRTRSVTNDKAVISERFGMNIRKAFADQKTFFRLAIPKKRLLRVSDSPNRYVLQSDHVSVLIDVARLAKNGRISDQSKVRCARDGQPASG